uniref:Mobile element protein n=1 Tax=Rheinheimera sp. BAL341 TaxID=1708203 RepID=A0A486XH34_9GAMM
MARKADKIRIKLGWQEGILNPEGCRPKGMHWQTYHHLLKRYRMLRNFAILAIADEYPALSRFKK